MEFIDSHAHINAHQFTENWQNVVQSAANSQVSTIINNAGDLASSKWGIEQANKSSHMYTTVGIHPEFFLETDQPITSEDYDNLRRLVRNSSKVVAIGEIGLDYTLDAKLAAPVKQHELLTKQLEMAVELNLPVTLHVRDQPGQRKCFDDLMRILKQFTTSKSNSSSTPLPTNAAIRTQNLSQINSDKNQIIASKSPAMASVSPTASHPLMPQLTGVFHCWTGTPDQILQALQIGFYISFSGILTYKSAGHILDAAKLAPLDKILIETDAPYLTPEPARTTIRPSVNKPEYVIMTAEKLASIKGVSLQAIADATTQNARRLFKLMN